MPPEMGQAGSAEGNPPGKPGKPGKFRRECTGITTAISGLKATDPKDNARGIGEGVRMGTTYYGSVRFFCYNRQTLAAPDCWFDCWTSSVIGGFSINNRGRSEGLRRRFQTLAVCTGGLLPNMNAAYR